MTDSTCSACGKRIPDPFDKKCECGVWFSEVKPIRDEAKERERIDAEVKAYNEAYKKLREREWKPFCRAYAEVFRGGPPTDDDRHFRLWLARAREGNDQLAQAMALLERAEQVMNTVEPDEVRWHNDVDKFLKAQAGGEGE